MPPEKLPKDEIQFKHVYRRVGVWKTKTYKIMSGKIQEKIVVSEPRF